MGAKLSLSTTLRTGALVVLLLAVSETGAGGTKHRASAASAEALTESVLIQAVQGADAAAVAKLVKAAGGTVTHELGIIRAVAADLTLEQVAELRRIATSPRIYRNRPVRVSGASGGNGKISDTLYPTLVAADLLHDQGIDGSGVTVAVLDTGFWSDDGGVTENPSGQNRVLV